MRILYVASSRGISAKRPGLGSGRKISGIVACWRDAGHEVRLVGGRDIDGREDTPPSTSGASNTLPLYRRLSVIQPLVNSYSEWRDLRHDRRLECYLLQLTASWTPDLIWHRSSRLHIAPLHVAQNLGIPYVLEWVDSPIRYRYSLFRRLALQIEHVRMQRAFRIVVPSSVIARILAAQEGIRRSKFIIAYNAVDPQKFRRDQENRKRIRRELGVRESEVLIGYVGGFAWYHNTPILAPVALRLREHPSQLNHSIRFLIVGDGIRRKEFEKALDTYGVRDLFILVGRVSPEAVPSYLSACDVAVLLGSLDTICPIKVAEYMAAGLPSVVPDTPANREIVSPGKNGLLFTPGDAADLVRSLLKLINNTQMRIEMGNSAQATAALRLSWQATWGRALEDVFLALQNCLNA